MDYLIIEWFERKLKVKLYMHFFVSHYSKTNHYTRKHRTFNLHLDSTNHPYVPSCEVLFGLNRNWISFGSPENYCLQVIIEMKKSLIEKSQEYLIKKIFEACWYDVCMWKAAMTNPHFIKISKIFFWYQLSFEKYFVLNRLYNKSLVWHIWWPSEISNPFLTYSQTLFFR